MSSEATTSHSKIRNGQRKLVLHFDARNTVFVADLHSRISVEHALNTYISGVVWGTEDADGTWNCTSLTPSLRKPVPEAISLYKLTERRLVCTPSDRPVLRRTLGNFTQTSCGSEFTTLFRQHLELLRWTFPTVDPKLTVTGLDRKPYHYLLPSFYELLFNLHLSRREFCIILRTFGNDAPHFLTAVQQFTQGQHPQFAGRHCPLQVHSKEEILKRSSQGVCYTYVDQDGSHVELTRGRDIYEHWNKCSGVLGVVDDFEYWQNNRYHYRASKPLWINTEDSRDRVLHIMFDDNIRVEDDDNIVNLRLLNDHPNCEDGVDLSPEQSISYENIHYVQADLLQSIRDINYFTEMVNLCESNLHQRHEASQ